MQLLKVDGFTAALLVLIFIVLPVSLTAVSELYVSDKPAVETSWYVLIGMGVLASAAYLSIIRASLRLAGREIHLRHFIYSRRINADRILELGFHERLPDELAPRWRTNGISIGHVHIGNYRVRNGGKAFFMHSSSPVTVIRTADELVVVSTTKELHENIVRWYEQKD